MKLLRIISSLDPRGGGPIEGARRIDEELARLGHQVEVACLDDPGQPWHSVYPATVHALGPAILGYRYSPALVPWLRTNRQRFDAVIVDGLWQYHGFSAWRALAGTDTPYFVFTHGMLDPWFKRTYPLKHLKKWLYWPWAEYRVLLDAKAVLFTCEEERRLAQDSFWLYKANEVVTAFGTDAPPQDDGGRQAATFHAAHPETQGKRLLLYLSRIHEKKGCDLLIHAFAQVAAADPSLHLVMAGPDQTGLVATLKQQAQSLGIADRITWPGMLQGDAKWGAFHAAEVFCLPSHQENFGIVVAEALGCGKPVLISDKVNIWREIEADGAGIVRPDTKEGTADALRTWLAHTPEAQERMREAGKQCFENRYRIEGVAADLVNIITRHFGKDPSKIGTGSTT
ncbi:MAG: glycosyltransferase [Hydrogenophaga sp.]|nr:glycosyltransferase [Hydrogenophaga sp.]